MSGRRPTAAIPCTGRESLSFASPRAEALRTSRGASLDCLQEVLELSALNAVPVGIQQPIGRREVSGVGPVESPHSPPHFRVLSQIAHEQAQPFCLQSPYLRVPT